MDIIYAGGELCILIGGSTVHFTVEPLIMDTLKSGKPPYNGQTAHPYLYTFLSPKKGQPLNN